MSEITILSYEELISTCKTRHANYRYLKFKDLFNLEEGKFTYKNYRINLKGDISLITYNNKIDIKIDYYDEYNTDAIYISKMIVKEDYKILIYCKNKSINTKNSYLIKLKDEFKELVDMKYIYNYLDFNYNYILKNYYNGYNYQFKRLDLDKLGEMIIILPMKEDQTNLCNYLQKLEDNLNFTK